VPRLLGYMQTGDRKIASAPSLLYIY